MAGPGNDAQSAGVAEPAVLVEFADRPGMRQVSLSAPEAIGRSAEAIQAAFGVIRTMATDLHHSVAGLPHRPDTMGVEFGIKFDTEVGAIIAKAGVEAAITVRMVWGRHKDGLSGADQGGDGTGVEEDGES